MMKCMSSKYWPSELIQMERMWTDEEMECESGILSGETRHDEEVDLYVDLDVEEVRTLKRRAIEDMDGGCCVGGA